MSKLDMFMANPQWIHSINAGTELAYMRRCPGFRDSCRAGLVQRERRRTLGRLMRPERGWILLFPASPGSEESEEK